MSTKDIILVFPPENPYNTGGRMREPGSRCPLWTIAMNILFISTLIPPVRGTRALVDFITGWQRDHRVTVICPVPVYWRDLFSRKKSLRRKKNRDPGIPVDYFPVFRIPRLAYRFGPLIRAVEKLTPSPDIVVAHFKLGIRIGDRIARKTDSPLIIGLHASDLIDLSGHPRRQRDLGKIISRTRRVACRSNHILEKMREYYPAEADKLFFAFSGIPSSEILSSSLLETKIQRFRQQKVVRIVTVSSLIPRKNLAAVLHALSSLTRYKWEYTIVGEGEERPGLENLARALKIQKQVKFLGRKTRKEVLNILTSSHLFILISSHESFGLAYLEAFARGNLVIASENEGMQGIIEDGRNGFLCPAGNAGHLTGLLSRILSAGFSPRLEEIWRRSISTAAQYTTRGASQNYLDEIKSVFRKGG
jgi:glycosyltransferase involved in cell wall biosynthesis